MRCRFTLTAVLGGTLSVVALPVNGGGPPPPVKPPSPVSGWLFDDGTGTAAADAFSTRDGALEGEMGESNWMSDTPIAYAGNSSLGFDGFNDRILVSEAGIVSHAANSTVSAWFWWDDPTTRKQFSIFNERDECNFNIYSLHIERSVGAENGLTFAIFDRAVPAGCGVGVWQSVSTPIEAITTDTWHHAVGVLDAVEGLKLYLDGVLVATSPDDKTAYTGGTGPTTIGHLHTIANDSYWSGRIDEVVVFSHVLGDDEVLWLYQNSIEGLVCPADINDDGAVTIVDLLDLLTNWGPCPGPCPQDINSDGAVTIVDLLELLTNWGSCP